MKFSLLLEKSLHARLILGLALMLLPLLVLAGGTYYSFGLFSESLSEVVHELIEERTPVSHLEIAVQKGQTALHQYIHDGSGRDALRLADLFRDIDEAFSRSSSLPFGSAQKSNTLRSALGQWQQARQSVLEILSIPDPGEKPEIMAILNRADGHLDRTAELLAKIQELADGEIAEQLKTAENVKQKISLLNSILFLSGVSMVLIIGLLLARSILVPLRRIEEGIRRFAGGDLSFRLKDIGKDEMGGVMAAFNGMAEEIERDRKALREISARDPLTGLCNHQEFFRLLGDEGERSRRYRHPLSLLMLDLDHFKRINDTFGHPAGDKVLCSVAAIIRRELRQVDQVARYGGEEFAVILPETAEPEALAIAERICRAVSSRPLVATETAEVALTVSIGLAVFPKDAATEQDLVEKADQALYAAKNSGRNRVCRSGAGPAAFTPLEVPPDGFSPDPTPSPDS